MLLEPRRASDGSSSPSASSSRASRLKRDEIGDHPVEGRRDDVAAAREQPVGRGAVVLEVGPVTDAEAHAEGWVGTPSSSSRRSKLRVVAVVEDDEAGVDVVGAVLAFDVHRVRVPARLLGGLEDDDVVLAVEQVRADEPGDPRRR